MSLITKNPLPHTLISFQFLLTQLPNVQNWQWDPESQVPTRYNNSVGPSQDYPVILYNSN